MKKYHIFKINIKSLNWANFIMLLMCFGFLLIFFPNMVNNIFSLFNDDKFIILLLPAVIFYFILHEILHALGYIIHGANYKKITFGMELEKGVFYCLCKDDVTKKNVLISLMYPLFFIGIVTGVISIIFNLPFLLLLSILNIGGAVGDIMYFLFIIKLDNDTMFSEMDDGTSFALISKKDPSKYRHFGLDYVETVDKISREDFTRIKISKTSWICLLVLVTLVVIIYLL